MAKHKKSQLSDLLRPGAANEAREWLDIGKQTIGIAEDLYNRIQQKRSSASAQLPHAQPEAPLINSLDEAYQLFGLKQDAPATVVRQRYRDLMKIYHPDVNDGDPAMARRLNDAYQLIRNHRPA